MRKKILWVIALLFIITLITRFIEIKAPQTASQKPEIPCSNTGSSPRTETAPASPPLPSCEALISINQEYLRRVKPIFQEKCLSCHGNVEKTPLYSKLPPASWLVNYDIEEAQEHMNMNADYPFYSKRKTVNLEKHLQELREVLEENEMPPWYYKILHWQSGLSTQEEKTILNWVTESEKKLKE